MLHEMRTAKGAAWRDGQYDRVHASAATPQDRRSDPRRQPAVFPLHRSRPKVDAASLRLG